jgi:hypothetical protein
VSTSQALSDAYHFTWTISAGLLLVCLSLAAAVLKQPPPRPDAPAEVEDESLRPPDAVLAARGG